MGVTQVDYILNQTELTTVFCSDNYVKTILGMKENGHAVNIKNLVCFEALTSDLVAKAEKLEVALYSFE